MLQLKRMRTANFSDEEKLKFLRLLQENGQCIISKVMLHDAITNKQKEFAWNIITKRLNASNHIIRTPKTLKKLWQKLKTEAKVYKANSRHVNLNSGGPSIEFEDPVLELVVEMTSRGDSQVQAQECDYNHHIDIKMETFEDTSPNGHVLVPEIVFTDNIHEDKVHKHEIFIEPSIVVKQEEGPLNTEKIEGRQQEIERTIQHQQELPTSNETAPTTKAKTKLFKSYAAERLRAEQEKTKLILLQQTQMTELHNIKVENEKLKKKLLETLINKISDGSDMEVVKVVLSTIKELD